MTNRESETRIVSRFRRSRRLLEKARSTSIKTKKARHSINEVVDLVDVLIEDPHDAGPLIKKAARFCRELHGSRALNNKAKSWVETALLELERDVPAAGTSPTIALRIITKPQVAERRQRGLFAIKGKTWVVIGSVATVIFTCLGTLAALGWTPLSPLSVPSSKKTAKQQDDGRKNAKRMKSVESKPRTLAN